ncbi:hypothetical protein [Spirochaeta cellobiosiphila]|uniref:hypothetical protein n=1 Tax=Spirochaeta cellobiosiphila TaxID=504483 RepID=UPI0004241CAD|nr:hypothetical protein [Spirochaeta cellobiosiphila]
MSDCPKTNIHDWFLEASLEISLKQLLLLFSIGIILIVLGLSLPIGELFQIGYWRANIVRSIIILMGILLDAVVIYKKYMGNYKVLIDNKIILLQGLFKGQTLPWADVTDVVQYQINDQHYLGFATQKMMNEAGESGFLSSVNAITSGYSELSIPLDHLKGMDKQDFVDRVQTFFNNYQCHIHQKDLSVPTLSPEYSNWFKGLGYSFLGSLVFGALYGLILFLINVNVVFIPFLGVYVCHYYLFRSIKEKDYGVLSRMWIALMGINQIILARMIGLWGNLALTLNVHNMAHIFVEYFLSYLPKYGMSELIWGVLLLATGVFGFLTGPSLLDRNRK